MDASLLISAVALIISIGSVAVAIWATRISAKSLDHSRETSRSADAKELDHIRVEVLMQISDSRRQLDMTRIEIGALQATFRAEKQPVRALLAHYDASLFGDYLPRVEAAIAQLDSLWKDISAWDNSRPYTELVATKALLYRCHKDDELVRDSAMHMIGEFRSKLELARQHAEQAVR